MRLHLDLRVPMEKPGGDWSRCTGAGIGTGTGTGTGTGAGTGPQSSRRSTIGKRNEYDVRRDASAHCCALPFFRFFLLMSRIYQGF